MEDQELDLAIASARAGDRFAADTALLEILVRVLAGRPLTAWSQAGLAEWGLQLTTTRRYRRFLVPPGGGRPLGAGKKADLARALRDYGAMRGFTSSDGATVGPRTLQRLRARLEGPGKAGRPKKSDK